MKLLKLGYVGLVVVQAVLAQPGISSPVFEVAAIKRSPKILTGSRLMIKPGGRFEATGMTVKSLILIAFDLQERGVLEAPGWLNADQYDITAKADSDVQRRPTLEEHKVRLQNLLKERFKFKYHREKREIAGYALLVVKTGAKLRASSSGPGFVTSMNMFANALSQNIDRPIIDKTGLEGLYSIQLRWTTEDGKPRNLGFGRSDSTDASPSDGPSLFTALREELGLLLQPQKVQMEVLVIDAISRPSEN